jgi:hypothetical protein
VGYWKQSQHFDAWPGSYLPVTGFASVFGRSVTGAFSLLDGLNLNGGGLRARRGG